MYTDNLLRGAALAIVFASCGLGAAQAVIYDGLSYPQFKSILSQTNLGLTERVTEKGNRYLFVMVPGWTIPFVATSVGCASGQDAACDGFGFFLIDDRITMSASAMGEFNNRANFIRLYPKGDGPGQVIKGDYYARGGITEQNVLSAGSYFSVVLQRYLQSAGASAANGRPAAPAFAFTDTAQPEKFFAEFAKKGSPRPVPVGAKAPVIDDALIDELVEIGR
jgi:hypothetical protein